MQCDILCKDLVLNGNFKWYCLLCGAFFLVKNNISHKKIVLFALSDWLARR